MAKAFEKWEIAVAKNIVNQFLSTNGIRGYDFEDLLQECLLHWYQKRGKYRSDKKASKKTFMGHILRRRLQEILRGELADKRKANQLSRSIEVAPDQSDSDEDTYDLSDKKQAEDFHLSLRNLGLKEDLGTAISELSISQKRLCNLIKEGHPIAHISQILNKPRTTLHDEIKRIRRIFLDQGLKDYL